MQDKLVEYRRKRSASATPEPFGSEGPIAAGSSAFVVQKHAASHLHFDFRLEIGGVLVSWAVPKGPSLDPEDKRFAIATEDHPLEYGDFEGIIPKGNYGAGAVVLWDRGQADHQIEPEEGLRDGKLLFELYGYKLRGLFTLVRTRKAKEWLLIKKPDGAARPAGAQAPSEQSILSGLTVEELRDGSDRRERILGELDRLGARRREVRAAKVKPMLARLEREPFSRPGWIFELKYDGYRVLAERRGAGGASAGVRLLYRSGRDATPSFPDVERYFRPLPWDLVVDGEVAVLDGEGRPSFQRLQRRALLTRAPDIRRAAAALPACFFAFDLLGLEGHDLRPLPLIKRKALLREILPEAGPIRYADHVEERGQAMYEQVLSLGLEGMVGKDAAASYRGGRSGKWIKVRSELTGDFAVVGFTRPKSNRPGFGALHLAVFDGEGYRYAGGVGTGFDDRSLRSLRAELDRIVRPRPTASGALPTGKENVWVEPELAVEVRFIEYTREGHLRHPVFLRLRDDKRPFECVRDDSPPETDVDPEDIGSGVEAPEGGPEQAVEVSRPEKVFWPVDGYTKGDLDAYYRTVSPWLLPFLADRPVVLDRYPDGIDGKSFFQKNAPDFVPDWVVTGEIWSEEDGGRETRYYLANDAEALRYVINLGAIPLHVWHSRLEALQRPDWCVLDLDAKDAPFASVVRTAREIHRLGGEIGLETFVKTSGATGLHVMIPLAGLLTYDQSKQLGEVLAKVIWQRLPDETSIARLPSQRAGKVYLDFLQNGYGKLIVAPYSVRPRPGAPVSTPLRWSEVTRRLDPARFTLASVPARLRRMKSDPWAELLDSRPDLTAALDRLAALSD